MSVTSAISTALAIARCRAAHAQPEWDYCVNCLSWAINVGVPALAGPILAEVTAERERILAEVEALATMAETGADHWGACSHEWLRIGDLRALVARLRDGGES
jgi:hypothetical protein